MCSTSAPPSSPLRNAEIKILRLTGPSFNGYAFCDPRKQQAAIVKALDWVEKHPYDALFGARIHNNAKPGDRKAANLQQSIRKISVSAEMRSRAKFDYF